MENVYVQDGFICKFQEQTKFNPGWNSASYAATGLINMPNWVRTQQHKTSDIQLSVWYESLTRA